MSAAGHHDLNPDYLIQNNTNESFSSITIYHNVSFQRLQQPIVVDDNDDQHIYLSASTWFESAPVILLFIVYFIVIVAGVFGNSSLVLTICSQTSARFRNPLLVALCVADLMVTGVSAPLTILIMVMTEQRWSVPRLGCRALLFAQSLPVAASTISLFMLSLDRYATVKHPRLAQLRERRFLPIVLASGAWLGAVILCTPYLLSPSRISFTPTTNLLPTHTDDHNHTTLSSIPHSSSTASAHLPIANRTPTDVGRSSFILQPHLAVARPSPLAGYDETPTTTTTTTTVNSLTCAGELMAGRLHVWFVCVHTVFVFVIPAFGVLLNHLGVRKKLCALSLTARAAHGELPLPMPILRRPTHMIIVTGMANAGRAVGDPDSCSGDDEEAEVVVGAGGMAGGDDCVDVVMSPVVNGRRQDMMGSAEERRCMMAEARMRCNPRTPRSIRNSQRNAMNNRASVRHPKKLPSSELPLPQTSTLRSRRRLANMLVAAALIFMLCWSPHVLCLLGANLGSNKLCPRIVTEYSLLLGYAHSALSPLLYWILNHNSLRQSSCASFLKLSTIQKFMRTHLRVPAPPPPPSSTNEAALGPFNPRYIKARPQQYRPPASSYNLY